MAIDLNLIDKLLADYKKPEDIIGENGLLKQLTKALLERAMQAEMTDHLGYAKHDQAGNNSGLKCRQQDQTTGAVASARQNVRHEHSLVVLHEFVFCEFNRVLIVITRFIP
jgi:Transposase, Mutator family